MTVHIALLRGINVGGHKKVAMAELRRLLEEIGFQCVRTLLQSGNAVFRSEGRPAASLEGLIEERARERLGLTTDFLVRTAAEWGEAIARNPYPEAAERDPGHLLVMALKTTPTAAAVKSLRAAIIGREAVDTAGRQAYLVYPDGIGRSRLTISVIEKHLATRGTARNWNTVRKLAALAKEL